MAFEYLKQYITFNTIDEMDQEVEKHIQSHYYKLTSSERSILYKIASHCLDYPGTCHLKASTIADNLEISTKTVYRAIKKLESLNIIKKETTVRGKGGQGANIFIILPCNVLPQMSERENMENVTESKGEVEDSENQPSNSINLLKQALTNNNIYNTSEHSAGKDEKIKQYDNKYQQMLYEFFQMMPFADKVLNSAYEISLAIQMESKQDFVLAKDTIKNIAMDMLSHLRINSSVRAVVEGAYYKAIERRDSGLNLIRYNWLSNRKNTHTDSNTIENKPPFDICRYDWLST
ncbi:helix-turn-helix domain-containing protein [Rummeliibacillus sp. POC4]|uniref:helix-turn-helix domain-containing protein n=1 Tax=Rummeliibacillus sp. POC4 TaxID=2305899 RepID=UPI000E670324|nr:helix-turn-helix domain-containing protein [Rummeliibacillus sp. POC4]RIJ63431.1 helix-turn-helix domain-containing protein [Rummeliibacillus sp. POC4]